VEEEINFKGALDDFADYFLNKPKTDFPLQESVELEQEVWEMYRSVSLPQLGDLGSREKLSGATWTSLVVRQNHVVFQTYENPLHDVLFPIVRSSFEHAVYLWLLARNRVNEDSMKQLDARSLKHWQVTLANPGSDVPKSVSGVLPKMVLLLMPSHRVKQPLITIFKQVCDQFENGDGLYANYGRLSSFVHPGIQSGSLFVGDILDPGSRLAQAAEDDSRLFQLLRTSLISAGSALGAHDVIFGSTQFQLLVDKIAELFELPDDELRLPLKTSKTRRRR
jgi:hypothetical protein